MIRDKVERGEVSKKIEKKTTWTNLSLLESQ